VRRFLLFVAVAGLLAAAGLAVWAAMGARDRERQYHALLEEGDRAMADGDSYAAIEAFSGAIALRQQSMVAYYRRGEAHLALRRLDEAMRDLREAVRLAPDAPQPLVALGRAHEVAGDMLRAVDAYERAAEKLKAAEPAVLYTLALARYRAGAAANAPASAEKPLLQAIAGREAFPEALYLLGLVRRDLGNVEGAIAALEAAVRIAHDLAAAREELADLYRSVGRPSDEMRHLQALAQLDPGDGRRIAIALAEARHEQYDGALSTLGEAARRDPQDSRIQLAIGRIQLARAERALDPVALTRAREALDKALGGTARRSEGLALYGRVLYLSGDATAAERILREAVATTPVDLEAYAFLADAAERLGHPRDARDALINFDVLEGDTAPADVRAARARRIGALSLRANDARTALPYLAQAVTGGHGDAATIGLVARARWLTGDTAGAQEALGRALALDPADPDLQRLARAIR
jgi:tetratricopeptide (TPR) repeat protein